MSNAGSARGSGRSALRTERPSQLELSKTARRASRAWWMSSKLLVKDAAAVDWPLVAGPILCHATFVYGARHCIKLTVALDMSSRILRACSSVIEMVARACLTPGSLAARDLPRWSMLRARELSDTQLSEQNRRGRPRPPGLGEGSGAPQRSQAVGRWFDCSVAGVRVFISPKQSSRKTCSSPCLLDGTTRTTRLK